MSKVNDAFDICNWKMGGGFSLIPVGQLMNAWDASAEVHCVGYFDLPESDICKFLFSLTLMSQ